MQKVFINDIKWSYIRRYFNKKGTSLFRYYQEMALRNCSDSFKGEIIELGGEKHYNYSAIFKNCSNYIVSNIDRDYDAYIDVTDIKYENQSVDNYVMVSMLQHVDKPFQAINEVSRTLKTGGHLILINAFMHPVCDTVDYWRFSEDSYKLMLKDNFEIVKLYKLGGKYASMANIYQRPRNSRRPRAMIYKLIGFVVAIMGKFLETEDMSPIGFGVLAKKIS